MSSFDKKTSAGVASIDSTSPAGSTSIGAPDNMENHLFPLGVANLPHNYDYYICSGSFPWISDSDQHSMQPTNHHQGVLLIHTLYLSSSFLRRLVPLHNSAATSPLIHSIKAIICATSVLSLATLWALQHFRRLLLHAKCACVLELNWLRSPGSVPVIYRQNGSRHITS